jgi:hypothetical protein
MTDQELHRPQDKDIIDTAFQRKILEMLLDRFPLPIEIDTIPEYFKANEQRWQANIHYLCQHGLVSMNIGNESRPDYQELFDICITAKGRDYISLDGGLTAYYGKIAITFDEDMLRHILQENIDKTSLDKSEKSRLQSIIKTASSSALSEFAKQGVLFALHQGPVLFQLLQNMVR